MTAGASTGVDVDRLPIRDVALEVRELSAVPGERRWRVTFRRLAAIYFLDERTEHVDEVREVLETSASTGAPVRAWYTLLGKRLVGARPDSDAE